MDILCVFSITIHLHPVSVSSLFDIFDSPCMLSVSLPPASLPPQVSRRQFKRPSRQEAINAQLPSDRRIDQRTIPWLPLSNSRWMRDVFRLNTRACVLDDYTSRLSFAAAMLSVSACCFVFFPDCVAPLHGKMPCIFPCMVVRLFSYRGTRRQEICFCGGSVTRSSIDGFEARSTREPVSEAVRDGLRFVVRHTCQVCVVSFMPTPVNDRWQV